MCVVHVELKSHDRIRIFMLRIYFEQKAIVCMYFLCVFFHLLVCVCVCVYTSLYGTPFGEVIRMGSSYREVEK